MESFAEDFGAKISDDNLEELLSAWAKTKEIAERWHLDKAVATNTIKLFEENVMTFFKNIKESRQGQMIDK